MKEKKTELSAIVLARIAGILYLLIIMFGIFAEVFIRSGLIVSGDAAATASNILASESLFRFGFVADTIMVLSDVAIAVLFYILFKPVSQILSLTAAVFRLSQAAILGFNLLNYYGALLLLKGSLFKSAFEPGQLNALAFLLLDLHSHGYDLGLIFFAISNIFLGYLVIKSGYFPAVLGYGLLAAAFVYLTGSFIRFIFPGYLALIQPFYIVPLIAELAFCLWLLVKGVKVNPAKKFSG